MINNSKHVANFIFYIGIGMASLFGSGSLTYIIGVPEYTANDFFVIIFGVFPALAGLAMAYMGNYMRTRNRRLRGRRRH